MGGVRRYTIYIYIYIYIYPLILPLFAEGFPDIRRRLGSLGLTPLDGRSCALNEAHRGSGGSLLIRVPCWHLAKSRHRLLTERQSQGLLMLLDLSIIFWACSNIMPHIWVLFLTGLALY